MLDVNWLTYFSTLQCALYNPICVYMNDDHYQIVQQCYITPFANLSSTLSEVTEAITNGEVVRSL